MTKIQLSAEEMQLVTNSSWILTKHRIIEKVGALFGSLAGQMQELLQRTPVIFQEISMAVPPKISKGEKYGAMPWVVLDYPRLFSRENVFAIRCFFWWGNYFSITLHLKGTHLQQHYESLLNAAKDHRLADFYFSSEENEFNFDLGAKGYFFSGDTKAPLTEKEQQSFLKISYKFSFDEWDKMEQLLLHAFERFISITADNQLPIR